MLLKGDGSRTALVGSVGVQGCRCGSRRRRARAAVRRPRGPGVADVGLPAVTSSTCAPGCAGAELAHHGRDQRDGHGVHRADADHLPRSGLVVVRLAGPAHGVEAGDGREAFALFDPMGPQPVPGFPHRLVANATLTSGGTVRTILTMSVGNIENHAEPVRFPRRPLRQRAVRGGGRTAAEDATTLRRENGGYVLDGEKYYSAGACSRTDWWCGPSSPTRRPCRTAPRPRRWPTSAATPKASRSRTTGTAWASAPPRVERCPHAPRPGALEGATRGPPAAVGHLTATSVPALSPVPHPVPEAVREKEGTL